VGVARACDSMIKNDDDQKDAGFSLLELMVVVVIMSILALVIVPRIIDRPDQARSAKAKTDIASLSGAIEIYHLDNGFFPSTEQGLGALLSPPVTEPVPTNWNGPYIRGDVKDPWKREFQYLAPGVHGDFDIFTFGADGVSGGSGADADIGSWTDG